MINYEDIPIWLRCTNRQFIDPTYPEDGCKFWSLLEDRQQFSKQDGGAKGPRKMTDNARDILRLLGERGLLSPLELGKILGLTVDQVNHAVNNLTHQSMIYEDFVMSANGNALRKKYGVLPRWAKE